MSINGNIFILLTENEKNTKNGNKMETEKFDTETDKFGYVRFRFRCISVSHHNTSFM